MTEFEDYEIELEDYKIDLEDYKIDLEDFIIKTEFEKYMTEFKENANNFKKYKTNISNRLLKIFSYEGNHIDCYLILTLIILDYVSVDETDKICFYFDDFMRKHIEKILICGKSYAKQYISEMNQLNIIIKGSLNSVYYLNEKIIYYDDPLDKTLLETLNFFTHMKKLNLEYITDNKILNNEILNKLNPKINISEREFNLFRILTNHMVIFYCNTYFQNIAEFISPEINEFNKNKKRRKKRRKKRHKINGAIQTEDVKFNDYENQYYIFITKTLRQSIVEDSNYGYKNTYFHEDLMNLCRNNILTKVSAYRFFLNSEISDAILKYNKQQEIEELALEFEELVLELEIE